MEPIVRSGGVNRSEQILAHLCDRAFLPLWCYPNVYRAPNKELCDVLVVFGDDVILFSDKSCAYPNSGRADLDWTRWKRRAVDESVRQLQRAERWLRERPTEVYLDVKCTKRFPLPINAAGRFHQVVVAKGAGQDQRPKTIERALKIHGPVVPSPSEPSPFELFLSEYHPSFVHVLDDASLPILLSELDTATDFLDYLNKKKEAFTSGLIHGSFGEEETLAFYLLSVLEWNRATGERGFPPPRPGHYYLIGPGHWDELRGRQAYGAKKQADRVSYFWDEVLKQFGEDLHRGEAANPMNAPLVEHELIARRLASETRVDRRRLSTALLQAQAKATNDVGSNRTLISRTAKNFAYVFSFLPQFNMSFEEYRDYRRTYAAAYGQHSLRRAAGLDQVLVVATESDTSAGHSFDFVVLRRPPSDEYWDVELAEMAQENGWASSFTELGPKGIFNPEYPRLPKNKSGKVKHRAQDQKRKQKRKAQRVARRGQRH